jgi:hypothetical protein
MKRFKSIRTIPNVLLVNLAVVDILNTIANLPFFIIVGVLELNQTLRGRSMSLLVALTQNFFNVLKIMSMLVIMVDRFVAISWGLRYYVWKTKGKAVKAICAVWLVSTVIAMSWLMFAYHIDLGDASTFTYRIAYFNKIGKHVSFFSFSIFGLAITLISLLTCCSYKRQSKVSHLLHLLTSNKKKRHSKGPAKRSNIV